MMDAANRRQIVVRLLLAAEQEAQQIVNAAKTERLGKLQQAKEEAENELAGYRAEMEVEFQKKVAEDTGDLGANMKRLKQEIEEKINRLQLEAERLWANSTYDLRTERDPAAFSFISSDSLDKR